MRTFGDMQRDDYTTETGWFARQTPLGLIVKILVVVFILGCIGASVNYCSSWVNAGKEVVSPENVKEQWAFAYGFDESLGATARNWCSAKQAENLAVGDAKDQRISQRLAQENLYSANAAKYDAALKNAFEAKLVKPSDVPTKAPTLDEKVLQLNLTCG
jgi:hypothetical protein